MVMEKLAEAAREFEKKTGAPALSKLADLGKLSETINKLPNTRQLKLIYELLVTAERVSKTAPELDKVISLINEVNAIPADKLEKLEKVLKRIEGILKNAPEELLGFLAKLKEE